MKSVITFALSPLFAAVVLFCGCSRQKPEGAPGAPAEKNYQPLVGTNAFANCRNLKSVVLQEGVTSLGTCCFGGCTELEKIVFPESLEVVSDFVFANCRKLQEIAFGRNLQSIGTQAFAKCAALSLVTIPGGSAVSIGTEAFSECAPDIRIIN